MAATLYSTPRPLGTATADATGAVTFQFEIGSGIEPGVHRVVLEGERSGTVQIEFTVEQGGGQLPATGASTRTVAILAGALTAAGALATATTRRANRTR